jgi:hypothetical protein
MGPVAMGTVRIMQYGSVQSCDATVYIDFSGQWTSTTV